MGIVSVNCDDRYAFRCDVEVVWSGLDEIWAILISFEVEFDCV